MSQGLEESQLRHAERHREQQRINTKKEKKKAATCPTSQEDVTRPGAVQERLETSVSL